MPRPARLPLVLALLGVLLAGAWMLWPEEAPPAPVARVPSPTEAVPARPAPPPLPEKRAPRSDGRLRVVVTRQGRPQRAQVVVYRRIPPAVGELVERWTDPVALETDGEGRASLDPDPGELLVTAHAPELPTVRRWVFLPVGREVETFEVALAFDDPVKGAGVVVERGSGRPVGAAEVRFTDLSALPRGETELPLPEPEVDVVESDGQGRFALGAMARGEYRVEVRAVGFAPLKLERTDLPDESLRLELQAAGKLDGAVLDADGQGVEGAELTLAAMGDPLLARSGRDGKFELDVPPGSYRLTAKKGELSGSGSDVATVAAGKHSGPHFIRLGVGCVLEGVVQEQSEGAPIPGVDVVVSEVRRNGDLGRATTDNDGHYRITGLPPGTWDVVATEPAHSSELERGVTGLAGQTVKLDLTLRGTATLNGHVFDAEHKPLPGIAVVATSRLGLTPTLRHQQRTDAEGRFAFTGLELGSVSVEAAPLSEGQAKATRLVFLADEEGEDVELVLGASRMLRGVVSGGGGRPIEVVAVADERMPVTVRADASGKFAMPLPPDEWVVHAARLDAQEERTLGVTVKVVAEHDPDELSLELRAGNGVRGRVEEQDGAPSRMAWVRVSSGSRRGAQQADGDGRFTFVLREEDRGLVDDEVHIEAESGGRRGEWTGRPGGGEVVVRLEGGGKVEGRVVVKGAPLAGFSVALARPGEGGRRPEAHPWRFTGDRFLIEEVPSGPVTLTLFADDGRRGTAQTEVPRDGTANVTVEISSPVEVRARLVDGNRRPVTAQLAVFDTTGRLVGVGHSDEEGACSLSRLLPGQRYVLRALHDMSPIGETTFETGSESEQQLGELVLGPGAGPRGRR